MVILNPVTMGSELGVEEVREDQQVTMILVVLPTHLALFPFGVTELDTTTLQRNATFYCTCQQNTPL